MIDWGVAIPIWVLCGIGSAVIAEYRHAGGLVPWFLAGLFLGPIGVAIALVQAKPRELAVGPAEPVSAPNVEAALTIAGQGSFCPNCGHKRLGNFRYCTNCKFDFNTGVVSAAPAAGDTSTVSSPIAGSSPAAAPPAGRNSAKPILIVALIVAAVIGVVIYSGGLKAGAGVASADAPPAGTIWFGASFDPSTFAMSGRSSAFGVQSAIAVVAHVSRTMKGSDMSLRLYLDGQLLRTTALSWAGEGDVWGTSIGPLYSPGSWQVELVDVGGNVLSSGTLSTN